MELYWSSKQDSLFLSTLARNVLETNKLHAGLRNDRTPVLMHKTLHHLPNKSQNLRLKRRNL
jgi:hypothetical protein